MGWLDNSTNNVILDAVLTDYGRQRISNASNSNFQITKFALGDDEVNYMTIKKYGRTIGKEKIEKNTPVFEAFTNQNLSQKYRLFSTPVPVVYLPKLELSNSQQTIDLTTGIGASSQATITVTLRPQGNEPLQQDLKETLFDVHYPALFVRVDSAATTTSAASSNQQNIISIKQLQASVNNANPNQVNLVFVVTVNVLSDSIFNVYGRTSGNTRKIDTSIRVVGKNTGLSKDIPITITRG